MNDTVPDNPTPTTLPAANLRPGIHIAETDGDVYEVRYVLPYRHGGRDYVNLTVTRSDTGAPWQLAYLVDEPVTLASPEQVAEAGAALRREELAVKLRSAADQLHRLADDVIRHRLPVPRWLGDVAEASIGIAESRTDLERWADYLGASVRVNSKVDKIPAVRQVRGPLSIRMQSDAEPEPVELLTPEQWQERTGITVLDRDGWADGKSWDDPIWYPEWLRRSARSTVQMRTAAGVLEARLPEPVTVDGGPDDEADDDLCPDPWHEQSTVPTEACPACGDPAPVVAPTSTYSPAVVAAIGNHLAAEPTAPAEPLSLTPDPAPTNPADWTDYAKRLDRERPDWWREPRVGMAAPLRAMAGLRLRGGAAAQAAGLSGSDGDR